MKRILLFFLSVFLYADIYIVGHIHVGDDYFDNYIPTDPISYGSDFMYLDYPTNFYISKDMDFTGVKLADAEGIESDSNIRVYIDGNLVGTGEDGENIIYFDNTLSLKAGYHTIAVRGSCYNRRGREVSCNRRNVDNDDFYFKYYQLFSSETDNAINFDERIHVGDSDDDTDYYDDLSDDDAIPFWYPDTPQAKRGAKYVLNLNCNVKGLDINITRMRDVYKDNLDYVKLYVNDNLVKEWGIKSNGRYAEDLFYSYKGNINKDDNVSLVIINDYADSDDLDDISWDDVMIIPQCVYPNSGNFDVWDEDENISTKVIKTKIVNKKFDLILASLNKDKNEEIPFSGTVCTRVISDNFEGEWNETHWDDEKEKNISFNMDKAIKISRINIRWNNDKNDTCPLSDYNETNSSDDFAIRPDKFDISDIPDKVKAGSEFNLNIKALDYSGSPCKDYNETLHTDDTSVKVEYNISKSGCDNGELDLTGGKDFADGETNATFKYSEVGDLNITLKEIKGSEFAKVDEDDTPDDKRYITPVTKTLTFIPHHFKADINVSNYDKNFTYLDNNLSIYSLLDLNITAQNEQNDTTKNYNIKCYAKDVDVNLTPYVFRHDEKLSKDVIYNVFFENSKSKIYKNRDINFSVSEGNFTAEHNGSAYIKVHINFEKNISNPEDPFEYNISNAEINDSDVNKTYADINGSALFYYGYMNMNDIITVKNDFNISHEFMIYDENSTDSYIPPYSKEIIINWFLNTLNRQKDANISNFVVTKGYVYNDDVIDSVDVDVNDINKSLNLHIKRNDNSVKFAVVHIIDANASHLWYSKFGKEYNISKGSSCAGHFCFSITWKSGENENGVVSGDINGTKSDVNSSDENKKGVKIFR